MLFVAVVCALARGTLGASDGLERLPGLGWNSWNWIGTNGCSDACAAAGMGGRCHSEVVMRGMTDAMADNGLKNVGYEYINLSEGWPAECFRTGTCTGRFPNGTIMHDPDRYPSGIKSLADYVHSRGLKFGIYLDAGSTTCAGFPGSLGHEAEDVALIASWEADYLWLDGCNLPAALMAEKYELWSTLLNQSGREIVWEVSWPAYVWERQDPLGDFNTDLWYHSASVGHEFRFYNDNAANWNHILDIAASTHELNMQRFNRPGAWAFMDMLESGNKPLTFEESRSHFGLWVLMAQPLHLGNDIRNMSANLTDMFTNKEVIKYAQDPMGKMGWRANVSAGRLNGTQVWGRDLSDASRLVGLLNAGASTPPMDTCTWQQRSGGYYQVEPATPDMNYKCWTAGDGATLASMKAECCGAGTTQCVSLNHLVNPKTCAGCGCGKRNDLGGWTNDSTYEDWIVVKGHPDPLPPGPPTNVCVKWSDIGLNPYQNGTVRNLWLHEDIGSFKTGFCFDVLEHDLQLFHVSQ
eukprot:m.90939 g.90939  ORF g.90939 m.90939 type:complete len:522 (+) comp26438_c1_seq2:125-1690(+)